MTRFHKKRDGWLMVRDDGSCRFLGLWEGVRYRLFGTRPIDA